MEIERLRAQLQGRRNRILKANQHTGSTELRNWLAFVDQNPILSGVLEELRAEADNFDPDDWTTQNFSRGQYSLPDGEPQQAMLYEYLLREGANPDRALWKFAMDIFFGAGMDESVEQFGATFVEPLTGLIDDRLEESNFALGLLQRYKSRVEWFTRDALLTAAEASRSGPEEPLDKDLRLFLHDHGVANPFSQPSSPSGEVDILSPDEDERTVVEVKVWDTQRKYGRSRVKQGVSQAHDYAKDWQAARSYLVVFNLDEQPLSFESDGTDGQWPARIIVGDVTVFLVRIELGVPDQSASKRDPVDPIVITTADISA